MRPNIANVDCLIIVVCDKPLPDFLILDKLLLSANYADVECAVVVNKIDLAGDCAEVIGREYPFLNNFFTVSAETGEGIPKLKDFLYGKSVAFAGQSAVGKTSLINRLTGSSFLTGKLSERSGRGRHTTTYSRLLFADDFSLFDTPGFAELYADVHPADVPQNFQPYDRFADKCRFCDCTHTSEPDCAVRTAVENGVLSASRYERYKTIYKEVLMEYKKRYGK